MGGLDVAAMLAEFGEVGLGDARLNERLMRIAAQIASSPGKSFPDQMETEADQEALYRFLANDKVSLENQDLAAVTRRDPTIVPRVWPVAEAPSLFARCVAAAEAGVSSSARSWRSSYASSYTRPWDIHALPSIPRRCAIFRTFGMRSSALSISAA